MHKQSKIQHIYINTNHSNEDRQLQKPQGGPFNSDSFCFWYRINMYIYNLNVRTFGSIYLFTALAV